MAAFLGSHSIHRHTHHNFLFSTISTPQGDIDDILHLCLAQMFTQFFHFLLRFVSTQFKFIGAGVGFSEYYILNYILPWQILHNLLTDNIRNKFYHTHSTLKQRNKYLQTNFIK